MRKVNRKLSQRIKPRKNTISSASLEDKKTILTETTYNRSVAPDVTYITILNKNEGGIVTFGDGLREGVNENAIFEYLNDFQMS